MMKKYFFLTTLYALTFGGAVAFADDLDPAAIRIYRDPVEKSWVDSQNSRTQNFLNSNSALRSEITARAAELLPKNPSPRTNFQGMEFFIQKGSLYLAGKIGAQDRILVDVTKLAPGSAVADFRLSPDGKKVAYGISRYGSDWQYWKILDLLSGNASDGEFYFKNLGTTPMIWNVDSQGLYYPESLTAEEDEKGQRQPGIKFHALGDNVKNDKVVFEDEEQPHSIFYGAVPVDKNTVVVFRSLGGAEVPLSLYVVERDGDEFISTSALPPGQHWGRFLGIDGGKILIRSSLVGNRYGVSTIDSRTLRIRTVVPERSRDVLIQAQQIGDKLVLQYLDQNLNNKIRVYSLKGQLLKEIEPSSFGMGNLGALSLLTGDSSSLFGDFTYSTATEPTETIRFDVNSLEFIKLPSTQLNFDGSKIKTEFRSFVSRDGKRIPIFVLSRTDLKEPPSFAYLYAYGNIGIATQPSWNRKFQLALELGGIVAIPIVRGGGEYGLSWQKAGVFHKKRSLQDIAYASRWLKSNYNIKDGNVNVSGRSYGGMNTLSLYSHFLEDFTTFTPVVSVADPNLFLKTDGWWAADDFGFRRDDRTGEIAYDSDIEQYVAQWGAISGLPNLTKAKPIFASSEQNDFRVGFRQTIEFVRPALEKFGLNAPIYMNEYANGSHTARAEAGGDEATFLALEYSVTHLLPLRK